MTTYSMVGLDARQRAALDYAATRAGVDADGEFVAAISCAYLDSHKPKLKIKETEALPVPSEPVTKRNDVWILGNHRLMCGDSLQIADVVSLMDGRLAEVLVTDPPYGVSYASKNEFLNLSDKGNSVQDRIINDHDKPEEMKKFWTTALKNALNSSTRKASYYVFGPQGKDIAFMMSSVKEAGWNLRHMLIWAKNNHVLGRCDYHYKHEPILYGWREDGTHEFFGGSSCFSVLNFDKPNRNDIHPTMKPVALCAKLIENSTREGGIVLDLFGGSGSTMMACEQLNRTACMMEISPVYCDVIVNRWEKMTGQKATRISQT